MKTRKGALATAAALLLGAGLFASCSSDSPTAPGSPTGGGGSGGGGGGATTFTITVNLDPGEILVDDAANGVIVNVNVRRNDTGQAPPNGSTVNLTTNRGVFEVPDGANVASVVVGLVDGGASLRLLPGAVEGSVLVQARIEGSTGQAQLQVRTELAFALGSVTPTSGEPAGGETLTITGQGFSGPVQVAFQTPGTAQLAAAQVLSVSSTQIRVVAPPAVRTVGVGEQLLVNIQVRINVGETNETVQTLNGAFTYALGGSLLRPVVSTVTPTSGPNEGGTTIRIRGDGFESPVQVLMGTGTNADTFQGTEAEVTSVTRSEIIAITPSAIGVGQDNRNRFVNLLVRNQRTGAAIIDQAAFRYGQSTIFISAVGPTEGSHLGGTVVTIEGSGFDEPVAVSFAGVAATPISVSGNQVIARTNGIVLDSCGDSSGPTLVTNIETGDQASGTTFTYRVTEPLVSGVTPTSLPATGGTVTITGSNFESPVQVFFGDKRGLNPVVDQGGTRIRVTAPAFDGTFPTENCNVGGLEGTRRTPVQVDLRVLNTLTTCDDRLTDNITYTPSAADAACSPNLPNANFSFTVNGTVVSFLNSSTNATTFTWAFGDGSTSGVVNPTRDYAASVPAGETRTFTVVLTASNASGSDTQTRQVSVSAPAPPPPPDP